MDIHFKSIVILQPTSPQRTSKDLDKACKKILKYKRADSLVSSFELKNILLNKIMFYNGEYLSLLDLPKYEDGSSGTTSIGDCLLSSQSTINNNLPS